MRPVIIVIDKIEDAQTEEGKAYKAVTDKSGTQWKVKSGRGGMLEKKWDTLKENLAYELSIDTFKGYEYVADFELVKDELKQEAAKEVAEKSSGVSAQERGMFYKELGEWLRSGKLDLSKPINKALNVKYWAQMLIALDIKSEKKEETN